MYSYYILHVCVIQTVCRGSLPIVGASYEYTIVLACFHRAAGLFGYALSPCMRVCVSCNVCMYVRACACVPSFFG